MEIPEIKNGRKAFLRLAVHLLLINVGIAFLAGVIAFWFLSFFAHIPAMVRYIGIGALTFAGLLQGVPLSLRYLKLYRSDWTPTGKKVVLQIKEAKFQGIVGGLIEGVFIGSINRDVGEIRLLSPLLIDGASLQTVFFSPRKLKSYSESLAKGVMEITLFPTAENISQESAMAVADLRIEK